MNKLKLTITSFGYKYGNLPVNADVIINARSMTNPAKVEGLFYLNGFDQKVKDNVRNSKNFYSIFGLGINAVDRAFNQNRKNYHVAFGCTAGKHRSVVLAEELAHWFRDLEKVDWFREIVVVHQEQENWLMNSKN